MKYEIKRPPIPMIGYRRRMENMKKSEALAAPKFVGADYLRRVKRRPLMARPSQSVAYFWGILVPCRPKSAVLWCVIWWKRQPAVKAGFCRFGCRTFYWEGGYLALPGSHGGVRDSVRHGAGCCIAGQYDPKSFYRFFRRVPARPAFAVPGPRPRCLYRNVRLSSPAAG